MYNITDFNITLVNGKVTNVELHPDYDFRFFSLGGKDKDILEEVYLMMMSYKEMENESFLFSDRDSEEPSTNVYITVDFEGNTKLIAEDGDSVCDAVKKLDSGLLSDICFILIEDNLF